MTTPTKKRGRKPTTGRFETREQLTTWVWDQYLSSLWGQHPKIGVAISDIAAQCRVSPAVVNKILNTKEGLPSSVSNPIG